MAAQADPPRVQMAAAKHIVVMDVLQLIIWAESNGPLRLAPLPNCCYTWKMGTQRETPKVVRMMPFLLKELVTIPFEQYPPYRPESAEGET